MDKSNQIRKKCNTGILKKIADKYSVSTRYVRYCLTGERKGETPDKIVADYKATESALNKILEN
ncbi:hypothetical protein [Chryseobacterium herbae]|uniref:hypothetical protein n=1 Tax=Chryseobacterium herbae TaxID=2976476 RepID=UPI00223AC337|nr:hypothetical protein [Chryseobacterium sp. pc1-10]